MMKLRTEWTIVIKKADGSLYCGNSVYFNRDIAEEKAVQYKNFYENNPRFNGFTVEFWKARYLGSSLYDKERIW